MIKNILVVCLGNICRSPMAEALFKQRYPDLNISSAGLRAITVSWSADPFAIRVMKENGMNIRMHRAKLLTADLLNQADLVVTMEQEQSRLVQEAYPDFTGRIIRIGEYGNFDVPDPYSRNINVFYEAFDLLSKGIEQIDVELIQRENSVSSSS